jgi:xylan 1,4-beta-xylosidase
VIFMQITNPILPGFNPDPSIARAGDDYYIATSTFEWFPGVQIHHSRDLVNWRLITRPLTQAAQLDMRGNPNSGGIWAPCLTWADDQFWLLYTDVKLPGGVFKVTHNYLVTAPAIMGPWSDPIYLNSSGFDPSLFHDESGRKWVVNVDWDWRPDCHRFAGILLQEYDHRSRALVGPVRRIFTGSELGVTEGPHLYRRHGYYYLLTAEGGTGHHHAVTMARSESIEGPYEIDPMNPILTSAGHPDALLKKAGHADIVETSDGWYMVHLCSRPVGVGVRGREEGWSVLGRETAIQKVAWTQDGWLRLAESGSAPSIQVTAPRLATEGTSVRTAFDNLDAPELAIDWQSLRGPLGADQMSLSDRPGYLRLYGAEPPTSQFRQSLVARRQQALCCEVTTLLDFNPQDYKQMAGLICYYNTLNFHYLYVTVSDAQDVRELGILTSAGGQETFPLAGSEITLPTSGPVQLRAAVNRETLQFSASFDGEEWIPVGAQLDMTIISDEMGPGFGFTGSFFGLCCQDLSGRARPADFDWFLYRETP